MLILNKSISLVRDGAAAGAASGGDNSPRRPWAERAALHAARLSCVELFCVDLTRRRTVTYSPISTRAFSFQPAGGGVLKPVVYYLPSFNTHMTHTFLREANVRERVGRLGSCARAAACRELSPLPARSSSRMNRLRFTAGYNTFHSPPRPSVDINLWLSSFSIPNPIAAVVTGSLLTYASRRRSKD
ncbi:hypothetical protein EVAR_52037_1 [Eumeta japonica]|uniref:Uncharacterized protein n=1 Tax=Eumeta variegata TaxID=151549 RepID=A0A4C1Z5U8_EUMVA|nr:hypothetical protein EVAR_52037_1 [Eumeta japonica]